MGTAATEPASVIRARLVLENDLLTNEVGRLRVELDEARRAVDRHETSLKRLQADIAVGSLKKMDPEELRIRLLEAQALDDIHLLVKRLDGSVVGSDRCAPGQGSPATCGALRSRSSRLNSAVDLARGPVVDQGWVWRTPATSNARRMSTRPFSNEYCRFVNSLALRLILVHATGSSYRRTMEETQSSMSRATTQS